MHTFFEHETNLLKAHLFEIDLIEPDTHKLNLVETMILKIMRLKSLMMCFRF